MFKLICGVTTLVYFDPKAFPWKRQAETVLLCHKPPAIEKEIYLGNARKNVILLQKDY